MTGLEYASANAIMISSGGDLPSACFEKDIFGSLRRAELLVRAELLALMKPLMIETCPFVKLSRSTGRGISKASQSTAVQLSRGVLSAIRP